MNHGRAEANNFRLSMLNQHCWHVWFRNEPLARCRISISSIRYLSIHLIIVYVPSFFLFLRCHDSFPISCSTLWVAVNPPFRITHFHSSRYQIKLIFQKNEEKEEANRIYSSIPFNCKLIFSVLFVLRLNLWPTFYCCCVRSRHSCTLITLCFRCCFGQSVSEFEMWIKI